MRSLEELAAIDRGNRVGEFVAVARLLMQSRGSALQASKLAEHGRYSDRVRAVTKAAVSAGTLDSLPEFAATSSAFAESLATAGAFDRLLAGGMVRGSLTVPWWKVASAIVGSSTAEGAARPISSLALAPEQLDRHRADTIVVMSENLLEQAGAMALLARELRTATIAATDRTFLAQLALGAAATASSGNSAAAIRDTLTSAAGNMDLHSGSRLYLIVSPGVALNLRLKGTTTGAAAFGEDIGPITPVASDNLPALGSPAGPSALLVDATGLVGAADAPVLDSAEHASIEMSDTPSGDATTPTGASSLVSLWQTNSRAIRVWRYFGFTVLRANSVQVITGVDW